MLALWAGAAAAAEGPPGETPLERRIHIERETRFAPFVLTPHKPNYLLPLTWNRTPNQAAAAEPGALDQAEIKFQLSIKFPITETLLERPSTLFFAYTNVSFWQAYNRDLSSPFRETNHEPELFLALPVDHTVWGGWRTRLIRLGVVHQSNGRGGSASRSWNRVYADFVLERGRWYISFKPWVRLPDSEDDNPDIEDFLGHAELRGVYADGRHTASIMLRNNLKADNRGAVELNWSFPMSRRVKWFVQYFHGYGESLIDYNARSNRLGVGIALTDWL